MKTRRQLNSLALLALSADTTCVRAPVGLPIQNLARLSPCFSLILSSRGSRLPWECMRTRVLLDDDEANQQTPEFQGHRPLVSLGHSRAKCNGYKYAPHAPEFPETLLRDLWCTCARSQAECHETSISSSTSPSSPPHGSYCSSGSVLPRGHAMESHLPLPFDLPFDHAWRLDTWRYLVH